MTGLCGGRKCKRFYRADVAALLDGIATEAPYMAKRVLAAVRRFWNWCLGQGKAETSPVANVKAPSQEVSRDRIFSDEEIAAGKPASAWAGRSGRCFSSCS